MGRGRRPGQEGEAGGGRKDPGDSDVVADKAKVEAASGGVGGGSGGGL